MKLGGFSLGGVVESLSICSASEPSVFLSHHNHNGFSDSHPEEWLLSDSVCVWDYPPWGGSYRSCRWSWLAMVSSKPPPWIDRQIFQESKVVHHCYFFKHAENRQWVCSQSLSILRDLALCFKVEKLAIITVTPHLFFWRTRSSFFPVTPTYFLCPNDYMTEKLISLTSSVFTVSPLTIPSVITQEDRPGRA